MTGAPPRPALRPAYQIGYGFGSGALILMYHRVADVAPDPWRLAVSPGHFGEHLDVIRRLGRPMVLSAMVDAIREDRLPSRAVALTFDDGYADNLHAASPRLDAHDVPATMFLVSGALGSRREFWWDELERVLLQPGTLPGRLRVEIDGRCHEWSLESAASYSHAAFASFVGWTADQEPPTARHAVYRSLYELLFAQPAAEKGRVLDELARWAGMAITYRESHRALSLREALQLGTDRLVELGAHTVTHPSLATLDRAHQAHEIAACKVELEGRLGRPIRGFSYPHGRRSRETARLVREAGYGYAATSVQRRLPMRPDLFNLTRIPVANVGGDEFERRLRWYMALDRPWSWLTLGARRRRPAETGRGTAQAQAELSSSSADETGGSRG